MKIAFTYNGVGLTHKNVVFSYNWPEHIKKNDFSITTLEGAFKALIERSKASSSVYNNRPKADAKTPNDFIVASVQGNVEDMAAYGVCTMNVAMFARDAAGFKNSKKLGIMQSTLLDFMPSYMEVLDDNDDVVVAYEIDNHPTVIGDAPDDYGFHARVILLNIIIKVL